MMLVVDLRTGQAGAAVRVTDNAEDGLIGHETFGGRERDFGRRARESAQDSQLEMTTANSAGPVHVIGGERRSALAIAVENDADPKRWGRAAANAKQRAR